MLYVTYKFESPALCSWTKGLIQRAPLLIEAFELVFQSFVVTIWINVVKAVDHLVYRQVIAHVLMCGIEQCCDSMTTEGIHLPTSLLEYLQQGLPRECILKDVREWCADLIRTGPGVEMMCLLPIAEAAALTAGGINVGVSVGGINVGVSVGGINVGVSVGGIGVMSNTPMVILSFSWACTDVPMTISPTRTSSATNSALYQWCCFNVIPLFLLVLMHILLIDTRIQPEWCKEDRSMLKYSMTVGISDVDSADGEDLRSDIRMHRSG
jgi:hypothetical protein